VEVIEGVVDLLADPPRADEPGLAEERELVAHGRLAHADGRDEVADAQFPAAEGRKDAKTARIGEYLEEFAEFGQGSGGGRLVESGDNPFEVELRASASEPGFRTIQSLSGVFGWQCRCLGACIQSDPP